MFKGIDVSVHQGDIDWEKVKKSGIDFAMLRTGYGIYSETQIDKNFHRNIKGAQANGISVGVYHYSYANSVSQAREEAKFCLDIIKNYSLEYPVCYDIEDKSIIKYNRQTKTDMCISFCDTIEQAGYYAMIYCNLDWLRNHLSQEQLLQKYDLWLAQWGAENPSIPCGIWQTSDSGRIDGIKGNVDTDISFKDYKSIITNAKLNKTNVNNKVSYVVKKGDTLWDIAKEHYGDGNKYPQIKEKNNLSSDTIYEGQTLIL